MEYITEMRQRLGLEEDDSSQDEILKNKGPLDRVKLICGWYLGDPDWVEEFKEWLESQGIYLTTNKNDLGILD